MKPATDLTVTVDVQGIGQIIGSLTVPITMTTGVPDDRAIPVAMHANLDGIKPELAKLLRTMADELEA